jgi:deazaflavin-dependent oxidoreductase (nitroreductase family)
MPSDIAFKVMNAVHHGLLRLTGNRVGATIGGLPTLELTTIGRRSGKPHSVMLSVPQREGAAYVVVGSRGGDDKHPAWVLNLRDNPAVEVRVIGGPKLPMRARIATPDERARIWPVIAGRYRNYASYERRTQREIPLVLLEP